MQGLDAYLEAPYVDAAQNIDEYEQWCEQEGYDPDEDHWDAFEEFKAEQYEDYLVQRAEDAADELADRIEMGDEWYE